MWHLKQAADVRKGDTDDDEIEAIELPDFPSAAMENTEAEEKTVDEGGALAISKLSQPGMRILPASAESKEEIEVEKKEEVETDSGTPWTSASSTKKWLDTVTGKKSWMGRNRANLYLATAGILLFAVIAGWGSHSAPAPSTSAHPRRNQAPQLSFGEKVLVELGLAVAPPAPVSRGNPDVRVWEDERTALYYCPGSDLYGKTERGKFSTQRDAQIDQFEPASRRACE